MVAFGAACAEQRPLIIPRMNRGHFWATRLPVCNPKRRARWVPRPALASLHQRRGSLSADPAMIKLMGILTTVSRLRESYRAVDIVVILAAIAKMFPLPDIHDKTRFLAWCREVIGAAEEIDEKVAWDGADNRAIAFGRTVFDAPDTRAIFYDLILLIDECVNAGLDPLADIGVVTMASALIVLIDAADWKTDPLALVGFLIGILTLLRPGK
jgi:hypothetical protein